MYMLLYHVLAYDFTLEESGVEADSATNSQVSSSCVVESLNQRISGSPYTEIDQLFQLTSLLGIPAPNRSKVTKVGLRWQRRI